MAAISLAQVISQVESSGNIQAVRFEESLFDHCYKNGSKAFDAITVIISEIHGCNDTTACMIACTSWGKYQILGENLYSPEFPALTISIFDFLAKEEMQDTFFEHFCIARKIQFTLDDVMNDAAKMKTFCEVYNGPANVPNYRDAILKAAHDLDVSIQAQRTELNQKLEKFGMTCTDTGKVIWS